jgi:hypothetical protein
LYHLEYLVNCGFPIRNWAILLRSNSAAPAPCQVLGLLSRPSTEVVDIALDESCDLAIIGYAVALRSDQSAEYERQVGCKKRFMASMSASHGSLENNGERGDPARDHAGR